MDNAKNNNPNEYLKMKAMTASAEELQLMLYDGVIRFCEQARKALQEQKIEDSYHLLGKAQKIVLELIYALRDEHAPEACANMRGLYLFCYDRLVRASVDRDVKLIDEALKILRHIRETWLMLLEKLKEEKAQEQSAPEEFADAIAGIAEEISGGEIGGGEIGGRISLQG